MKFWWLWSKRGKELDKEIQHHLQMAAAERGERGASIRDAESGAQREFGNVGLVKEVTRDTWGWRWLEDLFEDVRYGLRVLSKNPSFSIAAVLAIALGVGINVGLFSVLNGVVLRLLPVPRAEQILSVNQIFHHHVSRNVHNGESLFSYAEYLDYREHNHVFSGLLAYEPFVEATLGGGHMQPLLGTLTSCNYFEVLNIHPAQGRGFVDTDCAAPGQNAVVVVSDELWRGTFASDASLVGKQIILNRTPCTVIGIAAPGFSGTEPVASAFWAPITMQKELDAGRDRLGDSNMSWLALLGRVDPGVTTEQVHADLSVIAGRIDQSHPGRITSLAISRATLVGRPDEREFLIPVASVVLAAFGLVLLIACANVSNLLLARASVRQKEIALRLSMGASRWRLVRQLLTESLLLSAAGGALGSLLAFWSFAGVAHFLIAHLPKHFPTPALDLAPDFPVLAYALALTLLTGVAFGLLPALQSSRLDLNTALKADGAFSGSSRKSGRVLRDAFVGAQIAVCMVLLLAAGLLLRGLYYAQTIDPGFDVKNVASAFLSLQTLGFDESRATGFAGSLRKRVADLPGVLEVAQAETAPLSNDHIGDNFLVPGHAEKVGMEYNYVSPEFFSVVGVPIVRGRGFAANDWRDGTPTIVTESTARRLWPGQDPLGKTFRDRLTGGLAGPQHAVVGVAKDARVSRLGESDTMYVYFPASPTRNMRSYLLIRFEGNVRDLNDSVREVARSIDADVPVQVTTLEDNMEVWRAPARIVTGLSGALGGLALLLALIGVYGMVSYSVSRSVREIGIRMALGADGSEVMSHVLRQAMRPVAIGCVIGVAGCAAVSWVLSSLLFGLGAHDPIAFISVPVFLLVVALVASYIPARRAMRVDPVVALRYE
ncbi:MAG TPA: ABC transporter permease [Candidatus Acidoferrum sp.]|jgi:predicted permease